MIKKVILTISIIVNVLLLLVFVDLLPQTIEELHFTYIESDTIMPDTIRRYLDWENYGVAASMSRAIRGGARVHEEDEDYYRLGEYAELLFLTDVFERAENMDTVQTCENRMSQIRSEMPDYGAVFDKIDQSCKVQSSEK